MFFPHLFVSLQQIKQKWYEKNGAGGDREALQSAYLAAHASLIARFSKWLDDGLFANPDEPQNIPEGEGFDFYIQGAISRQVMKWARQLLNEPIQESVEKYNELFMRQVYVIMSAYSGKEIKKMTTVFTAKKMKPAIRCLMIPLRRFLA